MLCTQISSTPVSATDGTGSETLAGSVLSCAEKGLETCEGSRKEDFVSNSDLQRSADGMLASSSTQAAAKAKNQVLTYYQ